MLFDTPIISEGTSIINTVVESGTAYPANGDPGEIFFRRDLNSFGFRGNNVWVQYADLVAFNAHATNATMHLTNAEKTLVSGITVSAATINTIPTIRADVDSVTSGFNTHKADMALHLTTAQNTFLDGLNLPTLTAANVNTLVGQTVLLSTQFANQTAATNKVAADLATHSGDQTVHVLPAQRTWLDGIDMVKITPAIINSLDTISAGGSAANRVLKTGDTMTGDLAMSGKKVTGLGTPTALTDSANKKYVDDSVAAVDLSSRVAKTGDTMTGDLAMSGKKVTGLGAPTVTTDAVTKAYADGKVAKTGDTMSGDLNMGTKKVTNLGAPTAVGDAATKAYVDGIETSVLSKVVLLSGSTMTGDLNMGTKKIVGLAAPTAGTDAATKAYVDAMGNLQLSLTGGTMSGVINMGNNKITGLAVPTVGTDAVTKTYADAIGNGKLNLTGGTMSGAIDMGANKITTTYVPVAAADLANKAYVDSRTATGGIADKADKLTTARHISVSGAATGQTATAFDGSANANIVVTSLDAAKLTGQVPNDSLTDIGIAMANTEAKDFYGTTDFNAMVHARGGGVFTIAVAYTNGPLANGASAIYTGMLEVLRRKFNAGPAIVQRLYHGYPAVSFERFGNFNSSNVWVWSAWEKIAYESSNSATATKLNTARKITLGSAEVSFDGSQDVKFGSDLGFAGSNLQHNSDMYMLSGQTGNQRPFGYSVAGNATGRIYNVQPAPGAGNSNRMFAHNESPNVSVGQYLDITSLNTEFIASFKPGVSYSISALARATLDCDLRQYIQCRDAAGAVIYTKNSAVTKATGDWQRLTMFIEPSLVPANTAYLTVYYGRASRTATSPAAMFLDVMEPMLQEGEYFTAYNPSSETCNVNNAGAIQDPALDWNTLTSPGTYVLYVALTNMVNAPPTTYWGKVVVTRMTGRIVQEYIIDSLTYATFTRWSTNGGSTWKAWASNAPDLGTAYGASQVSVTNTLGNNAIISAASATQAGVMSSADKAKMDTIEAGSTKDWGNGIPIATNGLDLNSYITAGAYFCSANAVSATLLNNPTTKAFALQVYATAGCVQFLTEYTSSGGGAANRMWVRGYYNSIWNDWQPIYTSANPQLVTTTDTPGTNNTNIASTAFVRSATSGILNKTGLTGGTITLTATEVINEVIVLTGTLTSNLVVQFPNSTDRPWIVSNGTGGSGFTVTLRSVTAGNTVVVPQGQRMMIFQNTHNIEEADTQVRPINRGGTGATVATGTGNVVLQVSPNLTGTPTAITAATSTNNTQIATTAYVKNNLDALDASKLTTGTVANARLAGLYDGISVKLNGSNSIFSTPGTGTQSTDAKTVYGMVEYRTAASTTKGCLVFVAPDNRNNVMHMMEITGRTHTGGDHIWKALIGGYGAAAGWTNTRMLNLGTADLKARWGRNPDGKVCLILGDANTVWPYAHLSATVSMVSHSSVPDSYVTGWTTALDDGTLTGYTIVTAEIPNSAMLTDITGKAATATKLAAAVQINGTNFDGGSAITTANWGTARNLTIGSTAKSVNGSGNVAWSLAEIGAAPTSHTHTWTQLPYTPVQQGGGATQGTNLVKIGWANSGAGASTLHLQVDTTNFQDKWPITATSASSVNNPNATSAVTQAGNIGGAFANWTGALVPAVQVDASDNASAYMIWRATKWGERHIAAMHAYAGGTNGSIPITTLSLSGGTNQFQWNASGTFMATGDIIAFYSDERLKENFEQLTGSLDVVKSLTGYRYNANALAGSFGFDTTKVQVGLKAQEVQKVIPEAVQAAPFDVDASTGKSKSGEEYLTLKYERIVPHLIESIKELSAMVEKLQARVDELENR